MKRTPLHHIVRVRRSDDLTFVRTGLMDEIVVNANQLENSPQSTAASLWNTTLPFSVDPVLWRFQVPEWWSNAKGETKRNYKRLGAAYTKGTSIQITAGPLIETVSSEADWRKLASNAIAYQRSRLLDVPTQLDLLQAQQREHLQPVRLMAPALVAYSSTEDRINRLLADSSATAAGGPVAAQVIVPPQRIVNSGEVRKMLDTIPTDGINSYFVWTPQISEELLLADRDVFVAVLRLISTLSERGVPVGHQYSNYAIAALHDVGLSAVVHHLGWVDKGEPAEEQGFMLRSCQTYAPGVRHSLRFRQAADLARGFNGAAYAERYCDCAFCRGAFEAGQHPLDLLLEDQVITLSDGRNRRIPTGRAVTANTWHYLLSRRLEIEAFSNLPAIEVIERDIQRAGALAGAKDIDRLGRLANQLRSA